MPTPQNQVALPALTLSHAVVRCQIPLWPPQPVQQPRWFQTVSQGHVLPAAAWRERCL